MLQFENRICRLLLRELARLVGDVAVPALLCFRPGPPLSMFQARRRERLPVPQVPFHQLGRKGSIFVQCLWLLQVCQVRIDVIRQALLYRGAGRERGRSEKVASSLQAISGFLEKADRLQGLTRQGLHQVR